MIKNLKQKLFISAIFILFAAILVLFKIPCIILYITNVPCLGCGMTRAIISALKLDFSSAFSYHSMFWSVPFLYAAFLFDGNLFKRKSANIIFYSIIGLGFVMNWIFNLI